MGRHWLTGLAMTAVVLVLCLAPAQAQDLPAQSFAALRATVREGDRLIVWGADGRRTRGRVASIGADRLDVDARRAFRPAERRQFVESDVRRIDVEDPTWNGALIGLGVGGGAAAVACLTEDRSNTLGFSCALWGFLAPTFG